MIIEPRFNGPADSANGGYAAGLIAQQLDPPEGYVAQVTLRLPPPLGTALSHQGTGDRLRVYAGDRLVAEANAISFPAAFPAAGEIAAVSVAEAAAAARAYPGFTQHPFPNCYVCGPSRPEGDGLEIYPGPLADGRTAAPWRVPAGRGAPTLWAALDCPGGWTVLAPGRPYVLGQMAAQVRQLPAAGTECVVVGQLVDLAGRKAAVRTALYGPAAGGVQLLAQAAATWIELRTDPGA